MIGVLVLDVDRQVRVDLIGAKSASAAEARLLDETRGAPLLTMTRTTFDDNGRAVEHGDHLYRASQYAFELRLASG